MIEARHLCMMMRGVEKQNSEMVTSSVLGTFRESQATREEFLALIGRAASERAARGGAARAHARDAASLHLVGLTAPLFLLVAARLRAVALRRWPTAASDALTRFVFTVAVPTLLFRLMSDFARAAARRRAPADRVFRRLPRRLRRSAASSRARCSGWTASSQSVFAMGGIFSNNVLLGMPLAKVTLGEAALPAVSLVLVFNSLILWTLVTISVEWARHRDLSARGLAQTARGVLRESDRRQHPRRHGVRVHWDSRLPDIVDQTMRLVSQAAIPLSLIALGMGLAEFGVRARLARKRCDVDAEARRAARRRLRARAAARAAGAGDRRGRDARGAARRRERVPDVAPVRRAVRRRRVGDRADDGDRRVTTPVTLALIRRIGSPVIPDDAHAPPTVAGSRTRPDAARAACRSCCSGSRACSR